MMLPALLMFALTFQEPQPTIQVRCDTSAERLADLVHYAQNLRDDPAWRALREQWGWKGSEPITPVSNHHICQQAAKTLVADRWKGAAEIVAVVRVGRSYVAQPGYERGFWIVLDDHFRLQSRIAIPS